MRPARITPQIGPVGRRRIGTIGAKPGNRFAPRGDDRPHSPGERIAGIGRQEILIARQRVALERRGVGILHTEIAHRPVQGGLIPRRLRRRIRRTIEEHEGGIDLLGIPRHLRALACIVDAEPQAIENFRQRQSAGANHLGKRLGVGAIWPRLLGSNRARRGVERDQHMRVRFDQSQTARDRLAALDEGLPPGGVQYNNAGLERKCGKLAQVIADPQSLDWNLGVAAQRGIDGYKVVFAGDLHSIAREIDHRDGAGA